MLTIQVIGNLGADAELKSYNGREFITFRVAHTERYTSNGQEVSNTMWVDCTYNGNGGNLLGFLKKGKTVFVTGTMSVRIYDSKLHHDKRVGVTCMVQRIELCGGATDRIPNELTTTDGVIVKVSKEYLAPKDIAVGTVLLDRNLKPYKVREYGVIVEQDSEAF